MKTNRTAQGLGWKILLTTFCLAGTVSGYAQEATTPASDSWQFTLTPYLWTPGVSGQTRIGTRIPDQNVDASISSLLSNLDFGAMATFEARKDRWGILLDTFYVKLGHTSDPLLGGDLGTARLEATNTLLGLAGAYRVLENDTASLDVLLGVRYFKLWESLHLYDSKLLPAGRYESRDIDWTDAVIGVRYQWTFVKNWSLLASADVGTGGSQYSYQLIGGFGWDISKMFKVDLGYRLLHEDYSKPDFLYNMSLAGPYLGLSISW